MQLLGLGLFFASFAICVRIWVKDRSVGLVLDPIVSEEGNTAKKVAAGNGGTKFSTAIWVPFWVLYGNDGFVMRGKLCFVFHTPLALLFFLVGIENSKGR